MSTVFYATLGPELAGRWKLSPDGHVEIHANNIEEARKSLSTGSAMTPRQPSPNINRPGRGKRPATG